MRAALHVSSSHLRGKYITCESARIGYIQIRTSGLLGGKIYLCPSCHSSLLHQHVNQVSGATRGHARVTCVNKSGAHAWCPPPSREPGEPGSEEADESSARWGCGVAGGDLAETLLRVSEAAVV